MYDWVPPDRVDNLNTQSASVFMLKSAARASAGIHNLSISSNGHVSKQKLTLSRMAGARAQVITLRNRAGELACGHHLYKRFASHQRSNSRLVSIVPFRSTDPEYASSCSAEASRIPVYTVT